MKHSFTALIFTLNFFFGQISYAQVHVRGYTKSNGIYVAPHERTRPNNTITDNYSYPGNYNPNTGKITPGGTSGTSFKDNLSSLGTSNESSPSGQSDQSSNWYQEYKQKQEDEKFNSFLHEASIKQRYNDKLDSLASLGIKNKKHWAGEVCIVGPNYVTSKKISGYTYKEWPSFKNGPSKDYSSIDISLGNSFQPMYATILEVTKSGWVKIKVETGLQSYQSYKSVGYVEARFLN